LPTNATVGFCWTPAAALIRMPDASVIAPAALIRVPMMSSLRLSRWSCQTAK
jgi:hypothetical protein